MIAGVCKLKKPCFQAALNHVQKYCNFDHHHVFVMLMNQCYKRFMQANVNLKDNIS